MSNENKHVNIDVQEPLLENSGKKTPQPQSENSPKIDGETNNSRKQKPHEMERKRTKSTYYQLLSLYKRCINPFRDIFAFAV